MEVHVEKYLYENIKVYKKLKVLTFNLTVYKYKKDLQFYWFL